MKVFKATSKDKVFLNSYPKILKLNDKRVLVLTVPFIWINIDQKWHSTAKIDNISNVYIIGLDGNKVGSITGTIYDAQLLLDIKMNSQGVPTTVYFMRDKAIIKKDFHSVVMERDLEIEFDKKTGIMKLPEQSISRMYYFFPEIDKESFTTEYFELDKQIRACYDKKSIIEGYLHDMDGKSDLRATIRFAGGGIFTFKIT